MLKVKSWAAKAGLNGMSEELYVGAVGCIHPPMFTEDLAIPFPSATALNSYVLV